MTPEQTTTGAAKAKPLSIEFEEPVAYPVEIKRPEPRQANS